MLTQLGFWQTLVVFLDAKRFCLEVPQFFFGEGSLKWTAEKSWYPYSTLSGVGAGVSCFAAWFGSNRRSGDPICRFYGELLSWGYNELTTMWVLYLGIRDTYVRFWT